MTTAVLSGGGGPMASENYNTNASLGQPSPLMDPASPPYSQSYDLYPGFWYTVGLGFECWFDVDGEDLAGFADDLGMQFDDTDIVHFAEELGRTDCGLPLP